MAVTKIKPIYVTDTKAIEYISDDIKTDNGDLTEYFLCGNTPLEASKKFADTRAKGSGRGKILAQHVMQSFAPNEITPEQAFECGKLLAERLLKGNYQYVLATHIDKGHIHNHLIFCNTSMTNYKTFETNDNREKRSWKDVRNLSDEICREYKLSVIELQDISGERGQSHFEYTANSGGLSWKQQVKNIINYTINESADFEDFLAKMRQAGVQCVYKPENKIQLKYRLNGQQKFTRARTLGSPYDVDGICDRIERYKQFLSGENIRKPRTKLIDTTTEKMQSHENLERWAKIRNMKTIADVMLALEKKGVRNIGELNIVISDKLDERKAAVAGKSSVKKELAEFENLLKRVTDYKTFKPFSDEYKHLKAEPNKRKSEQAEAAPRFAAEHKTELANFRQAKEALSAYSFEDNRLPDVMKLNATIENLTAKVGEQDRKITGITREIGELQSMQTALQEYLGRDTDRNERQRGTAERQRDDEERQTEVERD